MEKLTQAAFLEKVHELNPNVEIIGEYINAFTKVTAKCLLDGNVWDSYPAALYRGSCPECGKRKISKAQRETHEEFVECMRIINPDIEVIGEYTTARNKVEVKCLKHDYTWSVYSSNLKRGQGCPICKSEKMSARAISIDGFISKLSDINPDIEVVGEFKNLDSNVLVRCNKHDVTWYSKGSRLLCGSGCMKCGAEKSASSQRLSRNEVEDRLKTIAPSVELVGDYLGVNYKTKFKCKICGNVWDATFSNISAGCGCPACASSKGESFIKEYLNKSGIAHIHQHMFNDCRYSSPLRFDFYIPEKKIAIEFQGIQHYEPVDFAGKGQEWASELLEYSQNNDRIKREYCKANSIMLIEIKYNEIDKIPEILDEVLADCYKEVI